MSADKADSREIVAKLQSSIPALQSEPIAATMKGHEFSKDEGKLTDQVGEFFQNLGNSIFRSGFGNVILDKRGVKSDIAHGIGRAKAITFAAIPDVIARGQQIDHQPNWKGRGYDTYVFAAPVDLAGQRSYVAAVVRSDAENRFYLHEVVNGDGELIYKIDAPATIKTGVTADGGITGTAEAPMNAPQTLDGDGRGENRIPAGVSSAGDSSILDVGEKNSFSVSSVPQNGGNVNPPGVEISERAKKQLRSTDRRILQDLSQITGSNIQFVTREQMDQIAGPGAEGVQRNGQIYISEDAKRPYMEIAKHEITHRLQQTAPENYDKLRDRVAELYRGKGVLDKYLRGVMADHARAGMEITEEAALDEITANYAEDLMWDEKAVRELAGEDRGLLTRMLDALRDFISKVKTAFVGKGNAETEELEQSAAMWQAALEESAGNKGKTTETAERVGSFSDEIARQLAGGDQRLATREGAELKRQIEALSRQNQPPWTTCQDA